MNIGHVQNYKIINCSWKINVLVLIRVYWWGNWLETNNRTGTFIRNSRVVTKIIKYCTKIDKMSVRLKLDFDAYDLIE